MFLVADCKTWQYHIVGHFSLNFKLASLFILFILYCAVFTVKLHILGSHSFTFSSFSLSIFFLNKIGNLHVV